MPVVLPVVILAIVLPVVVLIVVVVVLVILVLVLVLAIVIIIIVVLIALADSEFGAVILGSSLGDGHEDGLMVGGRGHGADTVEASGKTASDNSLQASVAISSIVDSLEEGKGVGWRTGKCQSSFGGLVEILTGSEE